MANHKPIAMGSRFGRLVVILHFGRQLKCRCDCGVVKVFMAANVRLSKTTSCGCLRKELTIKRSTKHGMCRRGQHTPEYTAWCNLRGRCLDQSSPDWPLYGGRGITFAERWLDFASFFKDIGPRPSPSHSIDRWPDMNGNYEPGNVRWATPQEQARNSRKNVFLEHRGIRATIAEWAERQGLEYGCLYYRLESGWSVALALETPSLKSK